MTRNKNKNNIYLEENNIHGYAMFNFLSTGGFKWIDSKESDLNKYKTSSSKECIFEVDLKYLKELRELRNDYPLAADKIGIKIKILSE